MIKLTLEECKSFKFSPIQYELEEIRIRELNVNLIYNLIDISQDETSLNILNRNDLKNLKDVPYKLIKFYKTYIGDISEEINPKTIINKIKKENMEIIFLITLLVLGNIIAICKSVSVPFGFFGCFLGWTLLFSLIGIVFGAVKRLFG